MMNGMKERKYFLQRILIVVNFWCLQTEAGKSDTVSLLFAGDINFSNSVRHDVEHNFYSYNDTFRRVTRYIREADVAIGNLESPFVPDKALQDKIVDHKVIFLNADKRSASALRYAGFDVISLANNHLNDFGEIPVNYTIDVLKQLGMKTIGSTFGEYDTLQTPLILERKGVRIGLLAYCWTEAGLKGESCSQIRKLFNAGPAIYHEDRATKDIANLKRKKVDVMAVFIHWGVEYTSQPNSGQRRAAQHLSSLGVQLIVGCHPHVQQPHSYHGNKLVAYSIGNLLFLHTRTLDKSKLPGFTTKVCKSGRKPSCQTVVKKINPTTLGQLLRVEISRKGVTKAQYLPFNINVNQTNHCLQPTPLNDAGWIDVCGSHDKDCMKN